MSRSGLMSKLKYLKGMIIMTMTEEMVSEAPIREELMAENANKIGHFGTVLWWHNRLEKALAAGTSQDIVDEVWEAKVGFLCERGANRHLQCPTAKIA